ncbi:MAG: T9SS type A sorting domain-containing protein, partial [Alloprevotella tannerae]|nr:T9SS type A sorting domain-containing protein [Alloprevotella tannerae]
APRQEIVLDSINGAPINSSSKIQLKAGEKVRFSGHVIKNNAVDTGFSGVVTGSLHDRKETITCKNNGGNASEAMVYTDWPNSLYEGSDSVKQGCFTLNITIPHEISYSNQNGRLSLYAVDNTRQEEAHGFNENFFMNGSAITTETDSIGPKIFIYLNTPDFPNGGYVKSDALLIATLSDSAGINTVKNSVGHALELVLDNQQGTPILLNDYFSYDFGSSTSGTVTYPLEGLTNGKHRLSLRAWDINDNSTTAYLDFIVSEQAGKEMDVNATQNPAKSNTLFITTVASDQAEQPVTTEVYDVSGRLIWSASAKVSGTYATINWDLTNSRGAKVNAGIYIYRSLVNGKHTKAKKMIVLKQ